MKIEKGTLQVDIREAFSSLSSEDKREVAKTIAFDNALIEAMCKLLTKSEIVWSDDEYEQAWYSFSTGTKNSDCLEPARTALLPLMPEIARQFIAQLIRERDSASRLEKQWRDHCWELQRRWSDTKRPDDSIDYSRPPLLSQEQVEALLKEWESSPTPDLDARIQAAAEEIEMAIEGYNIEQRQWARARSEVGGNIIADGFIGEALLNELNEWDANNPMPRPKTDIAKKIRRHIKISE